MYTAKINITLRKSILDPQGKAAHQALQDLGMTDIESTRIGKFVELEIEASDKESAFKKADEACKKLLVNEVMEDYQIHIE
ncbi:MAG TPA: phosphoribosylformylglycinamidine synthase subunit PurS [Balneolaceae bacterium]|nr:phosphoribosylformylglycinamidine synthase subunit PurS [Balneolaceae bacterium]